MSQGPGILGVVDARSVDHLMRVLAEQQHGLVSRDQLRPRGVNRQCVEKRLRSPDWAAISRRVLRLVGVPGTDEQRAMAAVLDAGEQAVLSHHSAAALWGLPGFRLRPLHASRSRSATKRPTALATVHHPVFLPPHHLASRRGIPVTTLVRTVFDVAGAVHPGLAEQAFHAALRLGLSWAAVEGHLGELGERGRDGISVMRQLVADHRGKAALESGLEGRFLAALRSAGLPEPRRQVDVGDRTWIARVDFLYDDVRLVLEVNGNWSHTAEPDVRRDQHRTARLVAAGYTVLPVPEHLVREAPGEAVRLVGQARRRLS